MTAACEACGEAFPTELACTTESLLLAGVYYAVLPHDEPGACPECGTPSGCAHHRDCPLERCPRCRAHLVDCPCVAMMPPREVITWTIDEEELATLPDSEAAGAIDRLVDSCLDKLETASLKAGMAGLDPGALRYEIARTMLIEMLRRLAVERAGRSRSSTPPSPATGST